MYVLMVRRKGDVEEVVVDASDAVLKQRGDQMEETPLSWRSGWDGSWAHSANDEEKAYIIMKATP